jgi:hypothetical protein
VRADGQGLVEPFDSRLKQVADRHAEPHRDEYPDRQVAVEERQVLRHTLCHDSNILLASGDGADVAGVRARTPRDVGKELAIGR